MGKLHFCHGEEYDQISNIAQLKRNWSRPISQYPRHKASLYPEDPGHPTPSDVAFCCVHVTVEMAR